jgi:hypothetical protein
MQIMSRVDASVETTPMLLRNAERLHTLGEGGGALLQMLSSLSANNIIASKLLRKISEGKVTNEEAWPHVAEALGLNLGACDQAIAGLKSIVKL